VGSILPVANNCGNVYIRFSTFLLRDAMLSAVYAVVVCLFMCVCLSHSGIVSKRLVIPHDSPGTLVFWHQSSRRNSNGITPYGGDKCRWGGLKLATVICALSNGNVSDDFGWPLNPQTTPIFAFFVAFYIYVVSKHRDFISGARFTKHPKMILG